MNNECSHVSILLPTNQLGDLFYLSLNSILNQTYSHFELIILINGLVPNSDLDRLKLFSQNHSEMRVYVLSLPGVGTSLNYGIEMSNYNLIARADADDIYSPEWLSSILEMMQRLDLDLVGCQLELIDANGVHVGYRKYPTEQYDIKKLIFYKNVFAHNTIIIKKTSLVQVGGYKNGVNTEDYDLWLRLFAFSNIKCGNLDKYLVKYRLHANGGQRKVYPYAEVCGYLMREFMVGLKVNAFAGLIVAIVKRFLLSKSNP